MKSPLTEMTEGCHGELWGEGATPLLSLLWEEEVWRQCKIHCPQRKKVQGYVNKAKKLMLHMEKTTAYKYLSY